MVSRMHNLLNQVLSQSSDDFCGLGLIVCNAPTSLPIYPLRETHPAFTNGDLVSQLVEVSSESSRYHDGFHVLSSAWKLTHVAQYFSPPIVPNLQVDRTKDFGGRYLAAMFGSALPNVMMCGIVSRGFGVAIFLGGREILFEKK